MPELSSNRRDLIATRLAQGLPVVATSLAGEFHVSEDAIRRDLRALADAGVCRRVYGGAMPLATSALPMAARLQEGLPAKRALAQAAVVTLRPGELVFLDCSSANVELARIVPLDRGLGVVSNSIDVAATLVQRGFPRLLLLGGAVDPGIGGCIDATAVEALARLSIDRCFVGACALSATGGVSVVDYADAVFKRAVMAASRQRLALVTADKLECRAPHRIGALSDFDLLVVEQAGGDARLDALTQAGATLLPVAAPAP